MHAGDNPPSNFDEQWCNYWLHSGHLSIDGLKMSKSLKNFITIRQALEEFSARQLRLLFCLAPWGSPITFNQQSRGEMVQKEATIKNFFLAVQARAPSDRGATGHHVCTLVLSGRRSWSGPRKPSIDRLAWQSLVGFFPDTCVIAAAIAASA